MNFEFLEIVPAIIAKSFDELQEKIKLVEPYVKSVQIDIMDGIFTPEKSWNNPKELKNINTSLSIEAHLMIEDVESEIERWLDSGVERILAHWEAIEKLTVNRKQLTIEELVENLSRKCTKKNVEFGIVLNLDTSVSALGKMLSVNCYLFSVVQLMSIAKIGEYGQPLDEKVIPKIKALKERRSNVKISVDGGINLQNAKQILEAGADVLVIGSGIFNSKDVGGVIKEIRKVINKQ